jgi:hypothetical protein
MGAGQSIPSTLTRQKVYDLTRDTRSLMDVLLDYMLKEITVRDFLALSNPTECKKYVIFMANNLYKYFYELQIVPTKDKRGLIAFRPVKELVNPPEEAEGERQSLCLTLAYFYTRIFQIYGALALTLVDDSKFMMDSGIIPMYGDAAKKGLLPPGYSPYVTMGGSIRSGVSGGAISAAALGNFNFLRNYLVDTRNDEKGFLTIYSGEDSSRGVVYFLPRLKEYDEYGRPIIPSDISETSLQKGIFYLGYTGAKKYSLLEYYSKKEGIGGDIKTTFGKLKYYKKDGTSESINIPIEVLSVKTVTIESRRPDGRGTILYTIKGSEQTIRDYFNETLAKFIIYLKKLVEGDVSTYTTTIGSVSESGTSEELRLARTIQNLTKTKPLGHCLARAMQLLQTVPLKGEPGVSYICKAKFFEQTSTSSSGVKTTVSRSGIPEPGSSLDSSPGMAALSQLFYDTVLIGSPKIVIGTKPGPEGKPSSLQQYIGFMKTMGRLFGDEKPPSEETVKAGLKGIYNKRDRELCGTTTGNISVPTPVTSSVYSVVNQLYKRQIEHSARCGTIIKLLFDIQRDKSSGRYRISLSDNIIKKGFPEIDRVNYLSRSLLIDYYKDCELTYLSGMKIVLDAKKKINAVAAVTAAAIPV